MKNNSPTYTKLITKAIEAFIAKGYNHASLSAIAKSCDLSKASIYHYVESKEALAMAAFDVYCDQFNQALMLHNDAEAPLSLAQFVDALLNFYASHNHQCLSVTMLFSDQGLQAQLGPKIRAFFDRLKAGLARTLNNTGVEAAESKAGAFVHELVGALVLGQMMDTQAAIRGTVQQMQARFTEEALVSG